MSRLVLVDGHAILHRAFHALPPQIKFNAIYGFMTMLLKVLSDLKPDYLVVAFDLPAANFRQQLYTQYQEKRPEMIGNLKDQIGPVHELLDALKISYFEVAGFEADDCIGTLAAQATKGTIEGRKSKIVVEDRGSKMEKNLPSNFNRRPPSSTFDHLSSNLEVYIVTGDRDMLQLVNEQVKVYVPLKGLTETKTYDAKLVEEEFGVQPDQWVDVKALKGDTSDNYPGVTGIGPKTAYDLIAKYETLENLYKHLVELPENTAKKLAEGVEQAGLAQKLAKIVTDVPGVKLELDKVAVAGISWEEGNRFMRNDLGFRSIPERIEKEILNKSSNTVTQSPNKEEKTDKPGGLDSAKATLGKQMKLI